MEKTFYIADLHFGHAAAIRFDSRPFKTIEEHDASLISRWNAVVSPDDRVYVIGDFAFRNKKPVSFYTKQLNGHIHLIRGNHDRRSREYEKCFESVHDMLKIKDTLNGKPVDVIMCHYWIPFLPEFRRGAYMLHGHTHCGNKEQLLEEEFKNKIRREYMPHPAYNTGCMWQDYYPQTLQQIVARQQA